MTEEQKLRYEELHVKIASFGKGGFMKLLRKEKEEYTKLKKLLGQTQESVLPKTYVIGMLDSLFKIITDGNHRAELLRWKREVQSYN